MHVTSPASLPPPETIIVWRGCGGTWPNFSSGVLSSPMFNGRALLGSLRVLIYNGRVPSSPPRVPSGPRLEWSGPGPRLSFTKILQWGRGVGGTLNTRAGCGRYLTETSRWGGSNIAVQTLLQTGCLLEQPRHLWRIRFQSNRFG